MLVLLSIRLIWCGSYLAVASGFVLLSCFAISLVGAPPHLTAATIYVFHLAAAGYRALNRYALVLSRFSPAILTAHWFAVVLPLITVTTFATIFVMANPDLVKSVGQSLSQFFENLGQWIQHFQFTELLFCIGVGWIAAGALIPEIRRFSVIEKAAPLPETATSSPHDAAYRNTLIATIALFVGYLVFEFQTLWFKTFPQGFHYSGYAHEGAAWLTVALGLATLTLSVIFRGTILSDPRLARLRLLSWIWSIENLLLAVAVFNRLFIYIGFNGMTRMRVVGMLGVASVVGGFLLVLRKMARNHTFAWLIRRQLWTVSFAVYLYAVLPVDAFVNQFNVNQIMHGHIAPCVQISVHPTSDEGFLYLEPLTQCSDETIRDGVRALLDQKLNDLESESNSRQLLGWTATQLASNRLFMQLRSMKSNLQNEQTIEQRDEALRTFHEFAFQWY